VSVWPPTATSWRSRRVYRDDYVRKIHALDTR